MASLYKTVFCQDLFRGKVAVVTGGGTGIGKAITKELARLGCRVVIASRKLEKLEEAAQEINKDVGVAGSHVDPSRVFSYECNIRNEGQVSTCKSCKSCHCNGYSSEFNEPIFILHSLNLMSHYLINWWLAANDCDYETMLIDWKETN